LNGLIGPGVFEKAQVNNIVLLRTKSLGRDLGKEKHPQKAAAYEAYMNGNYDFKAFVNFPMILYESFMLLTRGN